MGLPAWAFAGEDSEWEDRGPYLVNRRTGQKIPKGAAGGSGMPEETFADRMRKHGNPDRSNLEDRRGEARRRDSAGLEVPVGAPEGRPWGSGSVLDPRWVGPDHRIRPNLPPGVRRDLEESEEWTNLREEREDLIDGEFEPTRSPLVLRKRYANGTVTYVHAMTGQELFDLGEYGLNDPQGGTERDPYWRSGRREW